MDSKLMSQAIIDAARKRIKVYPRQSLWPSTLGHPCARQQEYWFLRAADAEKYSPELQLIFEKGHHEEDQTIEKMKQSGYQIRQTQRPLMEFVEHNGKRFRYKISGRIDFEFMHPELTEGRWYVADAKGLSPYSFDALDTCEDMLKHKEHYVRAYPVQLMLYLFMYNQEVGFFIFSNKLNGQLKFVEIKLDYDLVEKALVRAEEINVALEKCEKDPTKQEELLSPRIEYQERICGECPFRMICLPDEQMVGETIELDAETIAQLERRSLLKVSSDEFKDLDEAIKEKFKRRGIGKYLVGGSYDVVVREVLGSKYEIPDEISQQYLIPNPYLAVKIKELKNAVKVAA